MRNIHEDDTSFYENDRWSEWEDHFITDDKSNIRVKCTPVHKRSRTDLEYSVHRYRQKAHDANETETFMSHQYEELHLQYPLQFNVSRSYVLIIKRHENFTTPLMLEEDNDSVEWFEENFNRIYRNFSSFTYPYHKWNQKTKNYMIESERKAVILFTRRKIHEETQF